MEVAFASSAPPEDQLCPTCYKIDFRLAFNLRVDKPVSDHDFLQWSQHLGYLKDIVSRHQCPFCRLSVHALLARWPVQPCVIEDLISAKTIDNDHVKCYAHRTEAGRRGIRYRAAQISISTNIELPIGFPLPLTSHGDIAVLAEDVQALGHESLYHARLIGQTIDFNRVRGWLDHCENKHFGSCDRVPWEHVRVLPKSLRVIDVKKRCLVRAPMFPRYVALSYVWGSVQVFQAKKDVYQELMKEESLSLANANLSPVIKDAIQLTSSLKERYLWVDQLCIIQDDPEDKLLQVSQMDLVYAQAVLTIVAACGDDADARLLGLHPSPRHQAQKSELVAGLRLVVPLPTLPHALGSSKWNTRSWTFQEHQLSRRRLVFTEKQVYFQCRRDIMAEDVVCETRSSLFSLDREDRDHRVQSMSMGTGLGQWQWPFTLTDYAIAVELYTARHLSFPDDVLVAFLGIQNALQKSARWKFWHGLPEDIFDYAILWRPKGDLSRTQLSRATPKLSTISWAAWTGAVGLSPRTTELVSHIDTFEVRQGDKARQIKRRMGQVPNPNQGFPAGLIYDKSTEPHFLLHSLPTFSSALQTSKRLLGISQMNASSTSIEADTDALPMPAETLHFEASTATFAVSKDPILQGHTRGERDQDVSSSRALGSLFDEISTRDEARRYWIYDAHNPPWHCLEGGGDG
jgi:hypothetical protein